MIKERSAVGILRERERNFRTVFYTVNFSKLESDLSAIKFHLNLALLCYSFFSLFSNYSSKVNLKVNFHQILNLLKTSRNLPLNYFNPRNELLILTCIKKRLIKKKRHRLFHFPRIPITKKACRVDIFFTVQILSTGSPFPHQHRSLMQRGFYSPPDR